MGPQKSRELYRLGALGSNQAQNQPMAHALGRSPSQTDLRYHGAFLWALHDTRTDSWVGNR